MVIQLRDHCPRAKAIPERSRPWCWGPGLEPGLELIVQGLGVGVQRPGAISGKSGARAGAMSLGRGRWPNGKCWERVEGLGMGRRARVTCMTVRPGLGVMKLARALSGGSRPCGWGPGLGLDLGVIEQGPRFGVQRPGAYLEIQGLEPGQCLGSWPVARWQRLGTGRRARIRV